MKMNKLSTFMLLAVLAAPASAENRVQPEAAETQQPAVQVEIDPVASRAMTPEEIERWAPLIREIELDALGIEPVEAQPREIVRGPFLGVNAKPLAIETAKELGLKRSTGLLVNHVAGGGPAATAGLKKGDVLTKLNDQVLVNAEQFAVLVRGHKIGDTVTLHGLRDGEAIELEAKLGEADVQPLGPGGKDLDQAWRVQLNPFQGPGGNPLRPEIEIRPGVWIGDGWGEIRQVGPGANAMPEEARKMIEQIQRRVEQQRRDMDQRMKDLRLQLDLDLDELRERGALKPGGKRMHASMVQFDGEHRLSINKRDGQSQLKIEDKAGDVLYDGPLPEDGRVDGLPEDVQRKVDRMLQNTRIELRDLPGQGDQPKPAPDEPKPIS